MLRTSGCCLLLLALLSALNVHWAVLQGVAWASMLSKEQQKAATIREAIERTFGGDYPCEICGIVDGALEDSAAQQAARTSEYQWIKLIPLPKERVHAPVPTVAELSHRSLAERSLQRVRLPETPPPRVA